MAWAAIAHTGTTSETTLATLTLPANIMGVNGVVRVMLLWSATNNANNKTVRFKFGGSTFYAVAITTGVMCQAIVEVPNRNNASSQVGAQSAFNGVGNGGAAVITAAVNTANAVTMLITGELANSADTITIEAYSLEVLH